MILHFPFGCRLAGHLEENIAFMDDSELLRRYLNERSEASFAELVQRHLPLVYRAALRQTHGNAAQAEEISQAVFILLARCATSAQPTLILREPDSECSPLREEREGRCLKIRST